MPQIKTTDQNYVTDARKPVVMVVPYSAYPQAKADWQYNGLSLPRDNIHTSTDRTEYRLKDPLKADQGRYKVIIKNKHGEGEAYINLEVIGEFPRWSTCLSSCCLLEVMMLKVDSHCVRRRKSTGRFLTAHWLLSHEPRSTMSTNKQN